jgi:hypothetical protein
VDKIRFEATSSTARSVVASEIVEVSSLKAGETTTVELSIPDGVTASLSVSYKTSLSDAFFGEHGMDTVTGGNSKNMALIISLYVLIGLVLVGGIT